MPRLLGNYNFHRYFTRKTLNNLAVKNDCKEAAKEVSEDLVSMSSSRDDVEEEDIHIFEGKLSVDNWALTRR